MRTPCTRAFQIVETVEISRRKSDSSVAFVKAKIQVGDDVVLVSSSGKLTDDPEHVLIAEDDRLIVGGKHVVSVLGAIEKAVKNDVRKAAQAAALAELDAPAIALLPMLPPIVGASEKQVAHATRIREERFILAMRACVRHVAEHPETADDVEPIRGELTTNADARFWLDVVENTDGGIHAGHTLRRIALYMRAAGRAPSNA